MTGAEQPPSHPDAYPYAAAPVGNTFSVIAIGLALLSVAACPILFGPAAVALGSVAMTKDEPLWLVSILTAVVGLVGGMMLWIFVYGRVAPFV